MSTQTDFNAAYYASQPSGLQQLPVSTGEAQTFAGAGFIIDVPIMVWGYDPWTTMKIRQDNGMTWVPSALQLPLGDPRGFALPNVTPLPGQQAYPSTPPAGSIKVRTNPADFPTFGPATPVPPSQTPASADFVGPEAIGNLYLVLPGDPTANGQKVTDSRGTFLKVSVQTPFGFSVHYEKVA